MPRFLIKRIATEARGPKAVAERLRDAGFGAHPEGEDPSVMRFSATLFRDGIGTEISWKNGRPIVRAAPALARLSPAPDPEAAAVVPAP